jgi:hypothetical protein
MGGPTRAGAATALIDPVPTLEQVWLLRAALASGPGAIDAWRVWQARTTVDDLDGDSQWLLPLLYHNLHAQGAPVDQLVRYRNVYLHNWYKNSLTLRRAEPVIRALGQAGRVVLLAGGAMALRYYDAVGARPFGPLSVLAPARAGIDRGAPGGSHADVEVKATLFDPDVDAAIVDRATAGTWKTMRWLALDPGDQLLDICARRHEWDPRSRLFWLADAAHLLRRAPGLDWERVAVLSRDLELQQVVAALLGYLVDEIRVPIRGPAWFISSAAPGAANGASR